jgi:hypothetical protein
VSVPPPGGWQPLQPGNTPPPQPGPYGPPPWPGQQSWPQQPGPPPQNGSGLKWLLIGVGLLLVVAITIGATLLFTRGSGSGTPPGTSAPPTSGTASDIASANDTGPVAIITSEPTCQAYAPIRTSLANVEAQGWTNRDQSAPATAWTPEQRAQTEAVATAMRGAADQAVALAKETPHRVVRELYEQFIAYGRAYADSIPTYDPADDFLAGVNISAGSALGSICDAITYGSAASRSLAVALVAQPSKSAPVDNPAEPQRFLVTPDATCVDWVQREAQFAADMGTSAEVDPGVPANQWTPEQRATQESAKPVLTVYANAVESAGRQSGNPVLEDFAVLSAVYLRAYVSSIANYVVADTYLVNTGAKLSNLISSACRAAAG